MSATFIKRTTGELRHMVFRTGVSKGIKGVGMAYDPGSYGLKVVWDVQKQAYRMINLDGLVSITFRGETHEIEPPLLSGR